MVLGDPALVQNALHLNHGKDDKDCVVVSSIPRQLGVAACRTGVREIVAFGTLACTFWWMAC